jgi:hypothetical protein
MLLGACSGDFGRLKERAALEGDASAAGSGGDDHLAGGGGAAGSGGATASGGRESAGGTGAGGDSASGTGGTASIADAGTPTPVGRDAATGVVGSAESTMKQATVLCANFARCMESRLRQLYGDESTCVERTRMFVEASITGPGVAYTDADRDVCAMEMEQESCEDVQAFNYGPLCRHIIFDPGTLPDGAPCTRSLQCASGYCPMYQCGSTCSAKPPIGAPCGKCPEGVICAENKTCALPVERGGSCDDAHPCLLNSDCFHGTCTAMLDEGDTCDYTAGSTDPAIKQKATTPRCEWLDKGLICNSNSKKCQRVKWAGAGAACGWLDGTTYAECSDSGFCSQSTPRKCLPHANDGETCNGTAGPYCLPPAFCQYGKCVTVRGGTCE